MIPLKLRISGFLSYCDPVELDFTGFTLACISGANGAGKSSLLEAITWALFGQARKNDEALVNLQSQAAEVSLTFAYEGGVYRVQRSKPRGKSTVLEFQIQEDESTNAWRPLTERTNRETQARIEDTLRLDYETFINAAFFLQGKADQFTQQNASKRKEVLGNVLGLEIWETYKERTAERRKQIEHELDEVDGRVAEIEAELDEEPLRKAHLAELEARLGQLAAERKTQETALEAMKKTTASLGEQRRLVDSLAAALDRTQSTLTGLQARLAERETERAAQADLLERAAQVEAEYQAWQAARAEIERWDEVAVTFREHDTQRQPLLEQISNERVRLEQEVASLKERETAVQEQSGQTVDLEDQRANAEESLKAVESELTARADVEATLQSARQEQADRKAENEHLRVEMEQLKARIDQLETSDGARCPLCGQPLSPEERQKLIEQLQAEGKDMGDHFRANKAAVDELTEKVKGIETQLAGFARFENERLQQSTILARLVSQIESLQQAAANWKEQSAPRLKEIETRLSKEDFAAEARTRLAEVDQELKALGYDAAAHDAARRSESDLRPAEAAYRKLETARAALTPLEREIKDLEQQVQELDEQVRGQQKEHDEAAAALAAAENQAPDVQSAERELFALQEQENQLNQEVGAARQKVSVLDDLRTRKSDYETRRQELRQSISRHKTLERAFGKDGVPALLIEQALPQIESKANDLLDRLSNGTMSIRFVTQAEYKDKKRDDLKETLDIQISDGAGLRDYEMYSGGEAFRVNFAIRLALSEVLAQRKGARLQTLVIDEGFGSQDAQGRQRLIEAINQVRGDFEKVLVITHLDELKDAFPTRIEVEKTERGSSIRVS